MKIIPPKVSPPSSPRAPPLQRCHLTSLRVSSEEVMSPRTGPLVDPLQSEKGTNKTHETPHWRLATCSSGSVLSATLRRLMNPQL